MIVKCIECEIRKELNLKDPSYCDACRTLLYKKRTSDVAIESIKFITKLTEKILKSDRICQ